MKFILIFTFLFTTSFASIDKITSFQAGFTQSIKDEKNNILNYSGTLMATSSKKVFWKYIEPVKKLIYINADKIIMIEPALEQVTIKKINLNFDFFKIIKNAVKINKNQYKAKYMDSDFTIKIKNNLLESIDYIDEFGNDVQIKFKNQKQNKNIDAKYFRPHIPPAYDIIKY